jgi:hypothetical protein
MYFSREHPSFDAKTFLNIAQTYIKYINLYRQFRFYPQNFILNIDKKIILRFESSDHDLIVPKI